MKPDMELKIYSHKSGIPVKRQPKEGAENVLISKNKVVSLKEPNVLSGLGRLTMLS